MVERALIWWIVCCVCGCDARAEKVPERAPPQVTEPSAEVSGEPLPHAPPPDAACLALCAERGQCGARDDRCQARAREDCLRSRICLEEGRCTPRDGECVVAGDEDCARAALCRSDKQRACLARHGVCVESCADSERFCKVEGRCTDLDGRCVADSSARCRVAETCQHDGNCRAKSGRCVPERDEDCAQSSWCESHAHCTARDETCAVTSGEDCERSRLCREQGLCSFASGRCIAASDHDCAGSSWCRVHGRCVARDEVCVE
jgi:hypothetical protein